MGTVRASWLQSNLYPFNPVPPCSQESQEDLARQGKAAGLVGRRRKVPKVTVPLTGVVNSVEDTRLFDYLKKKKVDVLPTPARKNVMYRRGRRSWRVTYRDINPHSDVGDYGIVKKGKKPLRGFSNAQFVLSRKK